MSLSPSQQISLSQDYTDAQPIQAKEPEVNKRYDFNYYITRFFLNNTRLTILAVIFFLIVAVGATLMLKTTGFPSPKIPLAIVQTVYPGASSDTVNKNVTIPLESAIKNVEGVKRFTSTSSNSVSVIAVTIDETVDQESVKNQLDSALKTVVLPTEAQTPKLSTPEIAGPDIIMTIAAPTEKDVYKIFNQAKSNLNQVAEIATVEPLIDLQERVVVKIDNTKLAENKLSISQVQAKISTLGESIPVVANVEIDGQNAAIQTSLKKNSLEDLKNLTFAVTQSPAQVQPSTSPSSSSAAQSASPLPSSPVSPLPPTSPAVPVVPTVPSNQPSSIKLSDFASVQTAYNYAEDSQSFYGLRTEDGKSYAIPSLTFNIKSVTGSDQGAVLKTVREELKKLEDTTYQDAKEFKDFDPNKKYLIEAFTENEANQEQVQEVIAGLVGGPIKQFGNFDKIGYLLGGIQLVMIVMIALVSWRAAVISALAIPLSFLFSTLYLYLVGESLNTLTLFSLVLVTGLVVDPALVVLEAIQRKVDAGLQRKEAVLEGVRDVGMGVFLAMLTNIIVFVPFAVLSGIFGQIFRYIPLTVVPAIIGSYIVPLVVLAWFGGLLLKKNKGSKGGEEDNLWPIAKGLIRLNTWILNSPALLRLFIVTLILVLSLGISYVMFNNGQVKFVAFAESDDAGELIVTGNYLSKIPLPERDKVSKDVITQITDNENVHTVVSNDPKFGYYVFLKDKKDRPNSAKAKQIASDINDQLADKYGEGASDENRKFFDLQITPVQNAGPASGYQVSIAVKSEDLNKLKTASLDVSKLLTEQACVENNTAILKSDCANENKLVTKVDDGFTDRDNLVYDLQFDRDALLNAKLTQLGQGPLTIGLNSSIKSLYKINNDEKVATINIDGTDTEVVLEPSEAAPTTIDGIKSSVQKTFGTEFDQFGTVETTSPKSSIQRIIGQTTGLVQARLKPEYQSNQGITQQLTQAVSQYYNDNNGEKSKQLGLEKMSIVEYSDGQGGDQVKAFAQLGIALLLAIIISYIVLAAFFNSFLQPLSILYTIPITFIGVFPALAYFVGGQFGFLEVIGLIILVGIVENVAIFLIDGANQKIREENWSPKKAIAYASGVRFRPVILTKITTLVSLAPLAITSEFYRSISVTVIFGLLVSGFISLITTPILYIFFIWLSNRYLAAKWWNKLLFIPLFPLYIIVWAIMDALSTPRRVRKIKVDVV